ncbi:TIGR01777 family oxidoreductase [Thermoflavimicrobium daqui]|jgi:uncharacterized protein (TIGR01777 family)|uniref:TIGR01777 family protein n=1 Tax=Thermoflavimicrobium daqui TaxID=2137476 RepID=A0A364K0D9_9BACL|nr:TIGR01777 family oxidoreductase [Thermoflavimicrobium daqui]RAL20814.1 TIGR01777 family protein [Thermoflavimicrobium daqui]
MKIAITGATGFIGNELSKYLMEKGHEVIAISRMQAFPKLEATAFFTWDHIEKNPVALNGIDAIISLAGESINQRWTRTAKQRILQSRLSVAKKLAKIVEQLSQKPKVLINASGMSIYGTSETKAFDENSPANITDFLASVVEKWEEAIDQIPTARIIKLRIGVVLGNQGGAYPKMILPYKLGVGGKVGSGRQWISWVHIKDMIRLIEFCLNHEQITGPVNGTAPYPVTNDQFGRTVAQVLQRPHWMPVPAWMMKILFGELSVLLLEGQKVIPQKLLSQGFQFHFATIEEAIRDLSGK